ncbi:benzoate-CoA ligase family protein [bacterium]|nr:benzoate-CoA ligase family protein [bacterium]
MSFSPPVFPKTFNIATYFLEHNLEEGRAKKTAILYQDEKISYEDVDKRSRAAARVLRELGVSVEDRVLIAMPDRPDFVYAWFGTLKAGAVVAMANPLVSASDLAYYLDYTRARALVCSHEVAVKARQDIISARHLRVALVGNDPPREFGEAPQLLPKGPRFKWWRECLEGAGDDFTTEPTDRDDPAVWLFTSGSTGKPKGAVHFHHDFAFNTECYAKRVCGYRESDVTLSVPKLFFGYATGTNLMFPFAVGATAALFEERATAESVFRNVAKHRPTILTSVPTMINAMLSAPESERRDLSSLRLMLSAGEALPEELYKRWKSTYPVEILDGIGSAELFHIYISNSPDDVKPGSLGKLVPGYEARVVRPDGTDAPDGEVGTLWVKGDSAAVYYWQDHEKSKQVLRGDWVVSGDLFTREADGRFRYEGRADDMLKVGGVWVAPLEIENCLLEHAAVSECCVLGYEEEGLVKPLAVIVPRPGTPVTHELADELKEHVKKRLLPYKYPRKIVWRFDPLPKNDRGKTDRKSLKEALARGELS